MSGPQGSRRSDERPLQISPDAVGGTAVRVHDSSQEPTDQAEFETTTIALRGTRRTQNLQVDAIHLPSPVKRPSRQRYTRFTRWPIPHRML